MVHSRLDVPWSGKNTLFSDSRSKVKENFESAAASAARNLSNTDVGPGSAP
jgi:hypothetical protein